MKIILKPIFEMITGQYVLFDNILYNYIAMGIIGIIAFNTAWEFVGKLYNLGILSGKTSGSIIHWTMRLIVFIVVFYFFSAVIWITKFLYTYRNLVLILLIAICTIITIFKIIKHCNNRKDN